VCECLQDGSLCDANNMNESVGHPSSPLLALLFPSRERLRSVQTCSTSHLARRHHIAVFIDGESFSPRALTPLLELATGLGIVKQAQAYVTESQAKKWATQLHAHNIESIVVPRMSGDQKDPADVGIALGVAEAVLGQRIPGISAILVACNNRHGIIALLRHVRKWGLDTFVAIRRSKGSKAYKGLRSLQLSASEAGVQVVFYSLESLDLCVSHIITVEHGRSYFTFLEASLAVPDQANDVMEVVYETLERLGYRGRFLDASLAAFFHINQLGPLIVYPLSIGVKKAFDLITASPYTTKFLPYSGDLVYVAPELFSFNSGRHNEPSRKTSMLKDRGPFLLRVHHGLVEEVLQKLGFLYLSRDAPEAARAFCDMNKQNLLKRNFKIDRASMDILFQLQTVFSSQSVRQEWRRQDRIDQ